MSDIDFLDSNVVICLFDPADSRRRGIAEDIVYGAHRDGSAVISFQVVQEALNVLTRKLRPPMKPDDAAQVLHTVLAPLWRVHPSPALYQQALEVQERYRLSFYDSMIVAAALEADCRRILSEDLQHGHRIGNLQIVNPFQ